MDTEECAGIKDEIDVTVKQNVASNSEDHLLLSSSPIEKLQTINNTDMEHFCLKEKNQSNCKTNIVITDSRTIDNYTGNTSIETENKITDKFKEENTNLGFDSEMNTNVSSHTEKLNLNHEIETDKDNVNSHKSTDASTGSTHSTNTDFNIETNKESIDELIGTVNIKKEFNTHDENIDLVVKHNNNVLPSGITEAHENPDFLQSSVDLKTQNNNKTEKEFAVELGHKRDDLFKIPEENTVVKEFNTTNSNIAEFSDDILIKEEKCDIKVENDSDNIESRTENSEINDFDVKEPDTPLSIKKEKPEIELEDDIDIKQEYDEMENNDCAIKIVSVGSLKVELQHNDNIIKQEATGDDLTLYSYPNYDDSMDSSDAAAFCRVETCLDDGRDDDYHSYDQDDFYKVIKEEENLTLTDTHLVSNKYIDANSMIANHYDVMHNDKSLIMEIGTMSVNFDMKTGNPEAILPTLDNYNHEIFQLNSITGNVISLEEQAYDLLKAKKTKKTKPKNHPCPKCNASFTTVACLRKHIRVHINRENKAKAKKSKELTAKKKKSVEPPILNPKQAKELKKPVKLVQPPAPAKKRNNDYECVCGAVFSRKIRMETCMKSHNADANANRVQCLTCTKSFNSKDELESHRKRFHRKRFPCKFCPTDYDTGKGLFEHLKIHRQVQLTEFKVISEVMQGQDILKCFMCTNSFKELNQLKNHVMADHVEPYSCRYCKGSYPNILDFANHAKTIHPEVEGQSVLEVLEAFLKLIRAWKCEDCGLQFYEADKLALHQAETHNPDLKKRPQIQCEDCRRVFMSQKGLQSHRRVHHSIEVEETPPEEHGVMCAECRKICIDMEALTSHMRLHSPDRKFPCKFCDFRFATAEKRRVHQEIHTGDMKYVCFICEYQCTSENRLKIHKRSAKHQSMKQYLMSGAFLNEEKTDNAKKDKEEKRVRKRKKERDRKESSSSDSSDGSVLCDVCGDKFSSKNEMLEHKTSHPFIEFPNEDTPTRIFFKYH